MDKNCIIIILLLVIIYGIFNQKNNKEKFVENNKQFEYPWYEGEEKTNFVKDVNINTRPIYIIIQAKVGENKISVSSTNGFGIGDKIQILSSNGNKENNLVVGLGNNILKLNSKLINNYLPNTIVYNLSNPDIRNNKIKDIQPTKFYATLDSNDKLQYNQSSDPWGSSSYVGTMGAYQYTLSEADKVCKNKGLRLCAISEIIDKNICNAGWTSDRIRGYPMVTGIEWYDKKYANPNTRYQAGWCGGRSNGWRTWSTNPNNRGSAHCCKSNTTI